jgi:predicted transcriptional regulator
MSSYSLNLSSELLKEVQQLAEENRLSLDQWLLSAIAHKIETERNRKLFESYSEKADRVKFNAILARVPDVPPIPGDEL